MPIDHSLVRLHVRDDTVHINHGESVLATQRNGYLDNQPEQGLFVHETRMLSRYRVLLDGKEPEPVALSPVSHDSWLGYYIVAAPGHDNEAGSLNAPQGSAQQTIEMRVTRVLADGLHEDLDITNFTQDAARLRLTIELDGDFADQGETHGERQQHGKLARQWEDLGDAHTLVFSYVARHTYDQQGNAGVVEFRRGLELRIEQADSPPDYAGERIHFDLHIEPQQTWHACLKWTPLIEDQRLLPPPACRAFGEPGQSEAVFIAEATRFESPGSQSMSAVVIDALQQATRDLASLRMHRFDRHPRAWTVAAGLPMYVALFGRDTLTAAWEAALLGPEIMRGTLPILAQSQGTQINDWRDEQPGRMVHEAHTGPLAVLNFNPKSRYYGAVTASGFYPFVLTQLWHWTGDKNAVAPFIEPALKALHWLDQTSDGGVFHHYRTRSSQGVANQAWKDSPDAIVYADGSQVKAPVATCEEQGIVYAAKLNLAELLWWFDRKDEAKKLYHEAEELKRRFNEAFWMDDAGFLAMALDGQQKQVTSIGSNAVHCVATGIVDKDLVERTMARLFEPDMFSGWGVRTLSSSHPAYNPYSYHRGSVWPVEHGPFAVGAYRYGCHEQVERICRAQFDVASLFDFRRLPECISGHTRDHDQPFPALYPAANMPQAWSATTTFTMLQAMLGLQPFAPLRMLFVDPQLPAWLPDITLRQLRVGDAIVDLRFFRKQNGDSDYSVLDQRGGSLHVVRQPSPWSLSANFGERMKDLAVSVLPGR